MFYHIQQDIQRLEVEGRKIMEVLGNGNFTTRFQLGIYFYFIKRTKSRIGIVPICLKNITKP